MFWSDYVKPNSKDITPYLEEKFLLEDLKRLEISIADANRCFRNTSEWEILIDEGTIKAVANFNSQLTRTRDQRIAKRGGNSITNEEYPHRPLPCIYNHPGCSLECAHKWTRDIFLARGSGISILEPPPSVAIAVGAPAGVLSLAADLEFLDTLIADDLAGLI